MEDYQKTLSNAEDRAQVGDVEVMEIYMRRAFPTLARDDLILEPTAAPILTEGYTNGIRNSLERVEGLRKQARQTVCTSAEEAEQFKFQLRYNLSNHLSTAAKYARQLPESIRGEELARIEQIATECEVRILPLR